VTESIRVLLVDDHTLFRSGLAELLRSQKQFEVAGQAANGEEAVRKALELKPDVVLMDVQMPECNGIDSTHPLSPRGRFLRQYSDAYCVGER
jgi:DNA-binding NarL/FixJ family response regulator